MAARARATPRRPRPSRPRPRTAPQPPPAASTSRTASPSRTSRARGARRRVPRRRLPRRDRHHPVTAFEDRAVTWTGSRRQRSTARRVAGALGATSATCGRRSRASTSTAAPPQCRRLHADRPHARTAANVVRAIDAVTAKPETARTLNDRHDGAEAGRDDPDQHPEHLPRAAGVQHRQSRTTSRLAVNDGLDKLVLDTSPPPDSRRRAPTTCSSSIRKAITTI